MLSAFLRHVANAYLRPIRRRLRRTRHVTLAGITISYRPELDGGGTTFGQDFHPYLAARSLPRQGRAYEWCSGPGFIGFSLLGNGSCETLCLADINPRAVASCRNTVAVNRLADRVSVYQSNNLRGLPDSEQWNLVVSNPPHFIDQAHEGQLLAHDPQWRIHREFFQTVGRFLAKDGIIILQENNAGSTVESFRRMIDEAGLKIVFADGDSAELTCDSVFYYIGIMRKADIPPSWACKQVERRRSGDGWTWQPRDQAHQSLS